jgi:hypothetical protein
MRSSMFEAAQDDSVAFRTILDFSSADRSTLQDENEPLQATQLAVIVNNQQVDFFLNQGPFPPTSFCFNEMLDITSPGR